MWLLNPTEDLGFYFLFLGLLGLSDFREILIMHLLFFSELNEKTAEMHTKL
jgi:hypothetical protein